MSKKFKGFFCIKIYNIYSTTVLIMAALTMSEISKHTSVKEKYLDTGKCIVDNSTFK